MSRRLGPPLATLPLVALVALLAGAGCVERTLTIVSVPDSADVYLDGVHLGKSPLTVPFTHYGTREIVVRKPGYRVERHFETMVPPHFQEFPWDIYYETLTSNLWIDARTYPYVLEPQDEDDVSRARVDEKMNEAKDLRAR